MDKTTSRNFRLGLFVLTGTLALIYGLYMIGSNRNIFGSTFQVNALFKNVNGLMKGNNVRFGGIDVGTVQDVKIINDSSVRVIMVIETDAKKFIRKNALAGLGTDGLMGNKLVNIVPGTGNAAEVEMGDTLGTVKPIGTDEMLRTLGRTNDNIVVITDNLKKMTMNFSEKNSLWGVLMDTVAADNIKKSIVNIRLTSSHIGEASDKLEDIINNINKGKGSIGLLLTDTSLSGEIRHSIVNLRKTSENTVIISGDLNKITNNMDSGRGTVGKLLTDTSLVQKLNVTMDNMKRASKGLNEVIEGIKHSWPLKGYFKKQENERQKRIADSLKGK